LKRIAKLVVSLVITGVCFWWTFRHVNWDDMFASLRAANYLLLVPYLGMLTLIHVFRTLRWGNLLSGLEKVKFWPLNEASGIGFMMLIVLPFRLGEFARPFLIAERSSIRRSAAMTSVVFERIVDGIVIAVLLRVLLFFVPEQSEGIAVVRAGGNLMFLVFASGLAFLLIARWQHERTLRLLRAIFGVVSPKIAERVVHIVDGFVGALKQLPDAKNLFGFFLFTALYWFVNGVGTAMLANAFPSLHLTVFQGFVLVSVIVVGMMLPGAPGSAGTFQAAALLALGLFVKPEIVNSSGIAYVNVLWIVQMLQQILFGLLLMVLSNRSFRDIAGKLSEEPAR
jgi:uncharacterized protein (TIRG00374 family)